MPRRYYQHYCNIKHSLTTLVVISFYPSHQQNPLHLTHIPNTSYNPNSQNTYRGQSNTLQTTATPIHSSTLPIYFHVDQFISRRAFTHGTFHFPSSPRLAPVTFLRLFFRHLDRISKLSPHRQSSAICALYLSLSPYPDVGPCMLAYSWLHTMPCQCSRHVSVTKRVGSGPFSSLCYSDFARPIR